MRIVRTELRYTPMSTRLPFRYGMTVLESLPHLLVYVEIEQNGRRQTGVSADGLAPKWFTKNPATTVAEDEAEMRLVIERACASAAEIEADSLFGWWRELRCRQSLWAAKLGIPPLLWGFGVSLVERATIDALCRLERTSFAAALRSNAFGIRLGELYPELESFEPAALLPAAPAREMLVRHTVGLADCVTDGDIPPDERVRDDLPQSLEACIRAYGMTYFKIKLGGDPAEDSARLERIAGLFGRIGLTAYAYTLDGNEQFRSAEAFLSFWDTLTRMPALADFLQRLLFVEQPISRTAALAPATGEALLARRSLPPIIIDESDGEVGDLTTALALGYAGTSYKNCKGVIRGVANACLLERRRRLDPGGRPLVLSGEDLCNVGPVALLQDLTAMASLGIRHAERNGHHYFAGLSGMPAAVRETALADHGDLYRRHEEGYPTLDIRQGRIRVASLLHAPFGNASVPDPALFARY